MAYTFKLIKFKSDNTLYMSQNNNFFCTDYLVYKNNVL